MMLKKNYKLETEFKKDLIKCFKKIKINKTKNVYVTSNLSQISNLRIPKKNKLDLIFK